MTRFNPRLIRTPAEQSKIDRLNDAAPDLLAFIEKAAATKAIFASEADLLQGWVTMIGEARAAIAKATEARP